MKTNFDNLYVKLGNFDSVLLNIDAAGRPLSDLFRCQKPLNKQGKNSYGIREEIKMWFVNLEIYGSFGIASNSNDESTLGSDNK